jgi:hypothetical protein
LTTAQRFHYNNTNGAIYLTAGKSKGEVVAVSWATEGANGSPVNINPVDGPEFQTYKNVVFDIVPPQHRTTTSVEIKLRVNGKCLTSPQKLPGQVTLEPCGVGVGSKWGIVTVGAAANESTFVLSSNGGGCVVDDHPEPPVPHPHPAGGDCSGGLPKSMTPLVLLNCSAEVTPPNRTRFVMNTTDQSIRLRNCPSHALAVDCRVAGGMSSCGKLVDKQEPLVMSGALSNRNAPTDPENFGWQYNSLDSKRGSSVVAINFISSRPPQQRHEHGSSVGVEGENEGVTPRKCITGIAREKQVVLSACADAASQRWKRTSEGQFMFEGGAAAQPQDQLCLAWAPLSQVIDEPHQ